jgi:putative membrane protein (TIGR04086 family)
MFIGGFITGAKGKTKGWLLGLCTSIVYSFVVFLVQYLGYSKSFSNHQMFYHLIFLGVCVIGSIVGVNASSQK